MTHSHHTTRSSNPTSTSHLPCFSRKSSFVAPLTSPSSMSSKYLPAARYPSFKTSPSRPLSSHTSRPQQISATSSSFFASSSSDQPHSSQELELEHQENTTDPSTDVPSFVTQSSSSASLPSQNSPSETAAISSGSTDNDNDDDILIEFKDVHKSFGTKHILRGASFKIRRGEAVGIIGSSGTGKSTTLRLAAGLLQPDKGEVLIKGEPRQGLLSDDDTSNKLKVGLVFQSGALFDSLTVKENVGFMLYEHTDLPSDVIERAVARSLKKVGLRGVENLYPSELSGGMKKRVALARAIVKEEDGWSDAPRASGSVTTTFQNGETSDPDGSAEGPVMNGNGDAADATPPPPIGSVSSANGAGSGGVLRVAPSFSHGMPSHAPTDASSAEQLIMYDEPTAGLDPVASTVIEDLIRSLHDPHGHGHAPASLAGENASDSDDDTAALHGATKTTKNKSRGITSYVVVTHQHSTIRRAVDRLIFLHEGRVVWEGSVDEFDTTEEPIVRQFSSGSLKGPIVYV